MTLGVSTLAEAPLAGDTAADISVTGSVSVPAAVVDGNSSVSVNISGGVLGPSASVASILTANVALSGNLDGPASLVSGSTTSTITISGNSVGPSSQTDGAISVDLSLGGALTAPSSTVSASIQTTFAKVDIAVFGAGSKQAFGNDNISAVAINEFGSYTAVFFGSSFESLGIAQFGDYTLVKYGSSLSAITVDFLRSVSTSRAGSSTTAIKALDISSGHKHFSDAAIVNIFVHVLQDGGFVITGHAIDTVTVGSSAEGLNWWKPSWLYRRTVQVYAMDEASLPIGHPITIKFDSDFVATGRVRSDLHDLWVLYGGDPMVSEAETKDGRTFVYFYAQETIPAGESRPYSVYYGNPNSADEFTNTIEIPQA